MKKNSPNLVKVVNPALESTSGPAGPEGKAHTTPNKAILERAANSAQAPKLADSHSGQVMTNAWAAYRQSQTQADMPQTMAQKFKPEPMPLHVVPISRREKRPTVSYARMRSGTSFEMVSHVLANGSLMEPRVKRFASLELVYDEMMLALLACRERDLLILKNYLAEQVAAAESGRK